MPPTPSQLYSEASLARMRAYTLGREVSPGRFRVYCNICGVPLTVGTREEVTTKFRCDDHPRRRYHSDEEEERVLEKIERDGLESIREQPAPPGLAEAIARLKQQTAMRLRAGGK